MPLQVVSGGYGSYLAVAEVLNVAVGAEADVVGQVKAVVVGVFEYADLVGAPVPIIAEAVVSGSDAEVEAAEPEAFTIAAFDAPDMAASETATEAAVSPGMIDVIVGIIATGVVADPFAVVVDVRSFGVAAFVGILGSFRVCVVLSGLSRGRTPARYVAVTNVSGLRSRMLPTFFLRERRQRTEQEHCKNA